MIDGGTSNRSGDEVVAELVQLSARIDAAIQRQLALIREVHARDLWFSWGLRTCAEWLGWRLGLSPGAARERLRVALALGELPRIDQALGEGRVSFSKVRAMTRVATPENESDLLMLARNATAAQLEKICRGMRQVAANEGVMDSAQRWDPPDRDVSVRGMADGTARLTMIVAQDEAAQLLAVLDRVRAALREEAGANATPARADALVRMVMLADEALKSEPAADTDDTDESRQPNAESRQPNADAESRQPSADAESRQPNADAESRQPSADAESRQPSADAESRQPIADAESRQPNADPESRPRPRTRTRTGADHAMIALHLQPEVLADDFCALLDDGSRVPAETFRRVACDCAITATLDDTDGTPLDAGRKTRSISPSLRRALDRRDRGCRFPGCHCTRFVDAHHVEHWAHGGETKLDNLVTLCPFHHRLVHEGGFTVTWNDGAPVFRNANGRRIPNVPAETPSDGPLDETTGPLATDDDVDANQFWYQRRPSYGMIVSEMMQ
ncbi:MAG: DUF222 domain-containing protein [Deltaproteobacteria bacterium]|nr:DUF222 domain-containing protein [Deltaproteobacteria bacterium]